MIGALRGEVARVQDQSVIIDVAGVGYEVTVTGSVLSKIKGEGSELSLTIVTDVRETAITLYGFVDAAEREVFLLLKKVKGIGSRLALTIVSFLGAEELFATIGSGDLEALKAVPGVGKKTAERLLVELRESVAEYVNESTVKTIGTLERKRVETLGDFSESAVDAVLALEKLGFSSDRAKHAVSLVVNSVDGNVSDPGELVKSALVHL